MDKPVKILQIVGSMHPGGIENFVMNLYEHIDREQFPFDFVVQSSRQEIIQRESKSWEVRAIYFHD